jgi:hypothetical protein
MEPFPPLTRCDGFIERYKVRQVAKGFKIRNGLEHRFFGVIILTLHIYHQIMFISSKDQFGDIFTKPFPLPLFQACRCNLNLLDTVKIDEGGC